jgi:Tol biopolymer transport system component
LATKASNGLHELYLMRPDGSALHRLVSASDGLISTQPFWSRDSNQLLFKRFTNSPNVVDLWSVNVDGSQLYQVTHQPAGYVGLAWLP